MRVLLCAPTYFDVPETDIDNMYMDPVNRPNLFLAKAQHDALIKIYENLGLETWLIPPKKGLVDMTFTANCGLVIGKKIILSNFKPQRRRGEAKQFKEFFESLGYQIYILPEGLFFEGSGDAVSYKDKILCGFGFRTSKQALPYIERIAEKEVVPLELKHPGAGKKIFYHLDTAVLVMDELETLIAYRGAFTKESWRRLEKLCNLVLASYEDANNLALNAVVIPESEIKARYDKAVDSPANNALLAMAMFSEIRGVVVTSCLASEALRRQIENCHYLLLRVDLGEFLKSGGGAFCLTKILWI